VIVPSTRVFTKSDKHETSAYEYLHRTGQLQSYRPGMCAVLFTELSLYNPIVLISIRGSDRVAWCWRAVSSSSGTLVVEGLECLLNTTVCGCATKQLLTLARTSYYCAFARGGSLLNAAPW